LARSAELGPLTVAAAAFVWRAVVWLRVLALIAVLASAAGSDGIHAQTTSGDAAAKAKFTITIARFVQWPPAAVAGDAAPIRICVLHNSPALGAAFAALDGQRVAGHPVTVAPNPRERGDCGLLFIDTSVSYGSVEAIAAVAGLQSLTLGTVDGFLSQGGMIELANVNDTLRFDVNLRALRSARLDLSSQVLKLARQVRD
jgi:YfiR/HmsC-like